MIAFEQQTTPPPTASAASAATDSPAQRETEFTAVDPSAERYSGGALVVEAYAAIWVILMAWIFLLWRKQAGLAERLDDLERTIDRAAAAVEKKAKAGTS